jgi:hypothetical protein
LTSFDVLSLSLTPSNVDAASCFLAYFMSAWLPLYPLISNQVLLYVLLVFMSANEHMYISAQNGLQIRIFQFLFLLYRSPRIGVAHAVLLGSQA